MFFEAKKKYFLVLNNKNIGSFTEADSERVDKMSVKDSLFVHYLSKQVSDTMMFTIQEQSNNFLGSAMINAKFNLLNKAREDAFMFDFKKKGVESRVKIYPGENNIPYNGFSFYKITYKGELPKSLIKAYFKMNELNNKAYRQRYKQEQKLTRSAL